MSQSESSTPLGTPGFWRLYDQITSRSDLKALNETGNHLSQVNEMILLLAHAGFPAVRALTRPSKGWNTIHAWLSLRNAHLFNDSSHVAFTLQAGDVVTLAHQWDRDIFLTHAPIENHVSGVVFALLSHNQEGPNATHLFLPLFDRKTIFRAARLRIERNAREAKARLLQEADEWGWK